MGFDLGQTLGQFFGGQKQDYQAPQMNLGQYQQYMGQYDQGGGATGNAMGLMQSAAQGNQPSAAQMQMQGGLEQALAQGQAQAASTRGNFGLAGAQQNAMQNAANMSQDVIYQQGVLRAQEMAQARQQYMQAALAQRAQALQAAGLSADQAMRQAQLEAGNNQLNMQAASANQAAGGQLVGAVLGGVSGMGSAAMQGGAGAAGAGGAGGLAAVADLHMVDPAGHANITLREEPGFIAVMDHSTGKLVKLATEPLTQSDKHVMQTTHHGAGPQGADYFGSDVSVGGKGVQAPVLVRHPAARPTGVMGPGQHGEMGGLPANAYAR